MKRRGVLDHPRWCTIAETCRTGAETLPDTTSETPPVSATVVSGDGAVAVGGDNQGTINTGVIVNIGGDDIEKNRAIARTILAATLLAPPLDPARKRAIARYYRAIAKTLTEAAEALRHGVIPHGKCGEMLGYAHQLPAELGDVIGQQQAAALSQKLLESYAVERFGHPFMHLPKPERDAKFGLLDEAAGYFRAAVRSLQVHR
jgi:hypothetical protein